VTSLIFEQYLTKLQRKNKSPHTIRAFTHAAKRLDDYLAAEGATAETASFIQLEDYFDSLPYSPSTKATHLRYVQAAYNYAAKAGRLKHNPTLEVEVPAPDPREPRIISGTELRSIRDSITLERDWIWFHLLAYTGMRRAELRSLKWDDGDEVESVLRLDQQTIRVLGKGRKHRYVPIHPVLGDVLAECRRSAGAFVVPSYGAHGVAMDTIMEMSRRLHPKYTPHDYRRTVNTSLRRNGVQTEVRDRIMGWAATRTSDRFYDNVADAELQRAILRLYADDPV
jgi:integrase